MRRITIDTNIYVAFKNNDEGVIEAFSNSDLIGVDMTVIAELITGFTSSRLFENQYPYLSA